MSDCSETASAQTSSPEASPARTSASPERVPVSGASDPASGSRCTGSSPKRARAGSSPKTSQPFALADWTRCSGRSLRSGIALVGIAFLPRQWERLIAEIESG